jgi:hypothetical protein
MALLVKREDILHLGGFELMCYTLDNDVVVFSHTRILNLMMLDYTNVKLHSHLSALIPFLPLFFIERKLRLSVVFNRDNSRVRGIAHHDLHTLCTAIVRAANKNRLEPQFYCMAMISDLFLRHCSEIDINNTLSLPLHEN